MAKHTEALHHHHTKKRSDNSDKLKIFIDKLIYPIGILGPILTLPQLFEVWISKDASGLSLFTWTSWIIMAVCWLVYGIVHKERPIILSYIAWILIEGGVVLGILLYG